jgi:hypothetical protein
MTNADRAEKPQLLAMAEGALSWLHTNLEHGAMPADVSADLTENINDYKAITEMAVAASVASHALPAVKDRARNILDHCWQQMGQGNLLYERQIRHLTLCDPVEIYAHFAHAGYRHSRLEELLRHVHRLTAFKATELYPNRRLAVANAQRLAGLSHPDNWGDLAARTWLGNTPEPWAIDWDDAYCLTHTVYHLADWGRRPLDLSPPVISYLTRWLPVWLDVWSESQDWDLVAELLFVDICLPQPERPAAPWALLAGAQHSSGFVPRKGSTTDSAPGAVPDPAVHFRRHQHTTCVTVMAAALAASPPRAPA